MTRVYLALGSNLADPLHQVDAALAALDAIPHTSRIATSSLYRTPPYGPPDQPDYLNAVVALETALNAGDRARWISISCCLATRPLTRRA